MSLHNWWGYLRRNSEARVNILSKDSRIDVTYGTMISIHFHADDRTQIIQK